MGAGPQLPVGGSQIARYQMPGSARPVPVIALTCNLRALDSGRVFTDFGAATRLQDQLVDGFRRFEFDRRRKLGAAGADQLFLSGSDDASAACRNLVEDFCCALANDSKKTAPAAPATAGRLRRWTRLTPARRPDELPTGRPRGARTIDGSLCGVGS